MSGIKFFTLQEFAKNNNIFFEQVAETTSTNSHIKTVSDRQSAAAIRVATVNAGVVRAESTSADEIIVITAKQTGGRGRQGRGWETPEGKAVALSYLSTRFRESKLSPGWVPLMVGAAMAKSINEFLPETKKAGLKWPNDVHVFEADSARQSQAAQTAADQASADQSSAGRVATTQVSVGQQSAGQASAATGFGVKICGILCEMQADSSIIIGVGTNLFNTETELPTERAGSLLLEKATTARSLFEKDGSEFADRLMLKLLQNIIEMADFAANDPERAKNEVASLTHTIGQRVRAELPDGTKIVGVAKSLADDGSLQIETESPIETEPQLETKSQIENGQQGRGLVTVSAGDVWHLRPAVQ